MTGFLVRRLAAAVLLLLLVLSATFFLLQLAPGDPTTLLAADPRLTAEYRQLLIERWGLDQPLHVQYGRWLRSVVLAGDWGLSYKHQRPALEVVGQALRHTLVLSLAALFVQYVVGVGIGVLAAAYRDRWLDRRIRGVSLVVYALPPFWLALLAIELFGVRLSWFPISGMRSLDAASMTPIARLLDQLHHLVLPAILLGCTTSAVVIRFVRNGLLDVLGHDYIRAARARGLSRARVLLVHALPNAIGPVVQHFGASIHLLLGGSVIVEVLFAWPGVGRTSFQAIGERDYPVILAGTAVVGASVVLGSLFADLVHAWIDPRARERQIHAQ